MKPLRAILACVLAVDEPRPIPNDPRDHRASWCQNVTNEYRFNCYCVGMNENDACHEPRPETAICTTSCKTKRCMCKKRCET
jgi:hypothetical protein